MRAFLVACVAIVLISSAAYLSLNTMQRSTGTAYTTDGARISPNWAWRSVFNPAVGHGTASKTAAAQVCDPRKTWQWIFLDFGRPEGESPVCAASQ